MPGRYLTEEDERAEAESRERLRHAQSRLWDLRDRRGMILQQIRQLSDEQHELHERMAPDRDRVEDAHLEYRDLGHRLSELRARREKLRGQLDAALAAARPRPAPSGGGHGPAERGGRRGAPLRPDQIRREMAALELAQQTQALKLPEENALIDRLRALRKELEAAEKLEGERAQVEAAHQEKEKEFRTLRAEFEALGEEMRKVRAERDARMSSMKAKLVEVGQEISQIREKAQARGELFKRADEVNRQIAEVDREIRDTLVASRARRSEARITIQEYSHRGRESQSSVVAAQTADEQFEQLMKNGKVTLRG